MFIAKEALQKEVMGIVKQFDKSNLDKDDLARHARSLEKIVMDQERVITYLKLFAMNRDVNKGLVPPSYADDPADENNPGTINNKVISIRMLEQA